MKKFGRFNSNAYTKVMVKIDNSTFYIYLDISAIDFQNYYAQNINAIIASSHSGERIQFPANALQPFVSHTGVQGEFKIVIDENAKLKSITRVSRN